MDNFSDKSYQDFDESDFISDPYFQEWVIRPTEENEQFWNTFLQSYPEKREAIENARLLLKNLRFEEEFPEEDHIRNRFAEHLKAMESSKGAKVVSFNSRVVRRMLRIAAVVGGIAILASILFLRADAVCQVSGPAPHASDVGAARVARLADLRHAP